MIDTKAYSLGTKVIINDKLGIIENYLTVDGVKNLVIRLVHDGTIKLCNNTDEVSLHE